MKRFDRRRFIGWAVACTLTPLAAMTIVIGPARAAGSPRCGTWSTIIPVQDPQISQAPRYRDYPSVVYDSRAHRLIVFGGRAGDFDYLNDVWTVDLAGVPSWNPLAVQGTPPIGRYGHRAVFDSAGNRMIVMGGVTGSDSTNLVTNEVWSLSLADPPTWIQLSPGGTPPAPARALPQVAWDPKRGRVWLFGGSNSGSDYGDGIYVLDLDGIATWSQPPTQGNSPGPRTGGAMVYDSARDRLILFGGSSYSPSTFALDLSGTPTWGALSTVAGLPGFQPENWGFYDPRADQVIAGGYADRAHVLDPFPTDTWTPLTLTGDQEALYMAAAGDPTTGKVYEFGDASWTRNDLRELTVGAAIDAAGSPGVGGTVTIATDTCLAGGEDIALTAHPSPGYDFNHWSGDAAGTDNPVTVHVAGTLHVIAVFTISTATMFGDFAAESEQDGIAVRWSFGDPARVARATLERQTGSAGDWAAVTAPVRLEGDTRLVLDREVRSGERYAYRLRVTLTDGGSLTLGPIVPDAGPTTPLLTAIRAIGPNPTQGRTTIAFDLAQSGPVRLAVVDAAGRAIATLIQGVEPRGHYTALWDGVEHGRPIAPGLYFARLTTPQRVCVSKIAVAR